MVHTHYIGSTHARLDKLVSREVMPLDPGLNPGSGRSRCRSNRLNNEASEHTPTTV